MSTLSGRLGLVLVLATFAPSGGRSAPPDTAPPEGLRESTPGVHALVGARIVVSPDQTIEKGTLVVRDGLIVAVGADVTAPADARAWDMAGKTVYAGLIDAYGEIAAGDQAVPSNRAAPYWNRQVTPQLRADQVYQPDRGLNEKLRKQGITARLVAPSAGIVRGTSAVVGTGDDDGTRAILRGPVALHIAPAVRGFGGRDENYPSSTMGAVALVRQSLHDARWYQEAWDAFRHRPGLQLPERNDALDALAPYLAGEPVILDAGDDQALLRADQIARMFELNAVIKGCGEEYRRLDAVKATGRAVIVPLTFPRAPDVTVPEAALGVSLERLLDWDIAPENPGLLDKAGVRIALTSHGLRDQGEFLKSVRQAVKRGLAPASALKALTVTPAELFGLANRLGTLEAGKAANLVVTDGDLFDDKTKVLETWVDGRRYENERQPRFDVRGTWELEVTGAADQPVKLVFEIAGEPGKLSGKVKQDALEEKLSAIALDDALLHISFKGDAFGRAGIVRASGEVVSDEQVGLLWLVTFVWPDGSRAESTAKRTAAAPVPAAEPPAETAEAEQAKQPEQPTKALFPVNYPLGAFGVAGPPEQPAIVAFKGATVWTSGPEGIIEGARILVQAGRIVAVGKEVAVPEGAVVVDLTGKHVTPGIIDCHSHIAIDGAVNETGQTITAEVRIGDVVDANDVSIYRQLAGGVTSSNLLHGSANTIGGQNQVVKLRWGALAEQMKFEGAPAGIKFALGENPKQSNWGDEAVTRYPQTRMGVEQLVRDAFRAAQDYRRNTSANSAGGPGLPPRVDLELEAIAEVLEGKRLIHCHAYRQDEILALMRTCEEFGVRIATFQHILEGYKLADLMAKHGVGGSSFSDWWAYKFEVYDAIPYNGALMHNAGVVVSYNSDDAEMARRLNQEAAKAVKYGGVPPAEALKFVTLNAARQLGIEGRVGSLEPGKDADLAVWGGPPLSSYARCEQTWIDGRKYFDLETDRLAQAEADRMRAALIQRILTTGAAMDGPGEDSGRDQDHWANEDTLCGHGHPH